MQTFLIYSQIIISVLLSITILLQNRGSGLSAAFGGDLAGFHTKRGVEKFLFVITCVLGTLFIVNAFATIVVA